MFSEFRKWNGIFPSFPLLSNLSQNYFPQIDILLFRHPYRWIIFTENDSLLNEIEALIDSDILIPQPVNDVHAIDDDPTPVPTFNLKQFYKIEANSKKIYYENFGVWSPQLGIVDE